MSEKKNTTYVKLPSVPTWHPQRYWKDNGVKKKVSPVNSDLKPSYEKRNVQIQLRYH